MGSHHPRVPTLYENPQPRATGNEGHSFGLRLPADGAWGHLGADRHRKRGQSGRCRRRCKEPHTTGILLLVGMLSDKPPSSSTSPVAARGEKKKNLCWTLPIGLVCPLVPGLGPASLGLPGQHPSPDRRSLIYGGGRPSTPPDTAATSPRQADTTHCHQPENAMRRRLQAFMGE